MNPQHHLDPASLTSYASGAMPEALAVVAATHLDACTHCRRLLRDAESIGGTLIEQQQDCAAELPRLRGLRDAMLSMLEQPDQSTARVTTLAGSEPPIHQPDTDQLPAPLRPFFGETFAGLRWRWVAPGIHRINVPDARGGKLFMLKIAPGKSMPVHSHSSGELTQILRGAYDDLLGHFGPGDMADLDSAIEHQPVTAPGQACICVAALDAPLRFRGWFARALQPLVGM